MLINPKRPWDNIPSSEITPEGIYLNRRKFLGAAAGAAAAAAFSPAHVGASVRSSLRQSQEPPQLPAEFTMGAGLREDVNTYEQITTHNNFYEFGQGKKDPSRNSGDFNPEPWTVEVGGHCENPGTYGVEDIVRPSEVEDRIYRMRCVEAWSLVIPWRGGMLRNFISRVQPTSQAQYVRFETVVRPSEMPGQRQPLLSWPYVEGLRMDEATNELTLMVTGLYGQDLPNQNGAPLRLITPWKYGFKGIKSIVRIDFVEEMPLNTWQQENAREYGFFANVNPNVDHPRWSQARETALPSLFKNRDTEMFNGYTDQVEHMYRGMDLSRWY